MSCACMRRWIRRSCAVEVGHRELARDHRREPAHHDVADVGIGREHAQQLVAADADDLGRLRADRPREAARGLLEQRSPAEDVALLQDLRRLARVRARPERVLDLAGDDDVEVVGVVVDLVEDRALARRRRAGRRPRSCAAGRPLPPAAASSAAGSRRRLQRRALRPVLRARLPPIDPWARNRARRPSTRPSIAATSALWKCPAP